MPWAPSLGLLPDLRPVPRLAGAFGVVFTLRLLLGMGESIAYPADSRVLANNFPEHHRGRANALIDAGTKAGPALGTLIGGLLMARFGWRAFFAALGSGAMAGLDAERAGRTGQPA